VTTIAAPAASLDARGQRALAQLQHGVPNLGYTVLFLPGQAGYLGKGFHEERRIEIYVRDGESDAMLAHVVAHELGHAVDYVTHTPQRDAAYLRLRGVDPTTAWAPCGFCEDFGAPSGDFAEVYARWQLGAATPFFSRLAAPPSDDTLAAFGRLVAP
jgi:hypothetical protein